MRTLTASLAAAIVLLAASLPAHAGLVGGPLGDSGWSVYGAATGALTVTVDGEGTDPDGRKFVAIEITKTFVEPPDPRTGVVPSISLSFIQTRPDYWTSATRLYIADETITNLTNVTWTDFHWILSGGDVARFNRELTFPFQQEPGPGNTVVLWPPGSGNWNVSPFTETGWATDTGLGTETLAAAGGEVPSGTAFFPGVGAGNLVIDLSAGLLGYTFTLKEIPTIPEPASLLLIGTGAGALLLKRRASRA